MLNDLIVFLYYVGHSAFYSFILMFIGFYPLFGFAHWTIASVFYYFRKEKKPLNNVDETFLPKVSILIAAYNEEKYISCTLDSVCALNYPNYEVVVVNDGSTDNTLNVLYDYAKTHPIRIITKEVNQGKAIALNDAIICLEGEIIVFVDADGELEPDVLKYMIPHFKNARLAAVAGNPRIKNTNTFLCRMQVLEYASVIATIRRAQRIWGRIMTFSGVLFALRKTAFFDVGGFNANAPTEDIDLTWKLQRRFWDVFYEPRAVVWIITPDNYRDFFKQRLRWSKGLMYVIHSNMNIFCDWRLRRMWPILVENILSQLWILCSISILILASFCYITGFSIGISYVPMAWGISIATFNIIGQLISIRFDRKYDPQLKRYFLYTVYFPIYYWILLAFIAFIELPRLIIKPKPTLGWKSRRL